MITLVWCNHRSVKKTFGSEKTGLYLEKKSLKTKLPTVRCSACSGSGQVLDNAAIGRTARKRRIAARLTLKQVAAAMPCSVALLAHLEKNEAKWITQKNDWLAANEAAISKLE